MVAHSNFLRWNKQKIKYFKSALQESQLFGIDGHNLSDEVEFNTVASIDDVQLLDGLAFEEETKE